MSNIYYWKDIPDCRIKASSHVYMWKTISDLNDPRKIRGWLLPEKDFLNLINKKFEQVVLSIKLDYEPTQETVLSNYVPYNKNKIIKETVQTIFCVNDRTYKLMPVIYYKKDRDKDIYRHNIKDSVEPIYRKGRGVVKCGKVYMAFIHQNRIIDISQVDIFVLSKYH